MNKYRFDAFLVDANDAVIASLGTAWINVCYGQGTGNSSTNITVAEAINFLAGYMNPTDLNQIVLKLAPDAANYPTHVDNIRRLIPVTTILESLPSAGRYIKLVNESGYYARTASVLSQNFTSAGSWFIYDNNGNQLANVQTPGANIFPYSERTNARWCVATDEHFSDGTLRYGSAVARSNTENPFQSISIADITGASLTPLIAWLQALTADNPIPPDPYDNLPVGGDEPIPGGGTVGIPGFPGLTATSAGVIGLFAPSAAEMQLLADFMWTDFGGTGTTVEDILKEVVEALKRSISNPLDYIIGLNIIPSQGLSVGAAKVVRFGFISSGVSMPQLANQYFTVDCGTLSFDTVCGDTFLDYAPYSKFSIYLPYIGFKDVDPNDFVGHTIGVVYHGDCVTGGVTAYITKDGTVMYQYSGCCALNVPLSADNWGETISAAINVATGIVAAAASGGAAGLAEGALKGAASVAANPSLLSPQVSHSGAVSGGAGCMGVQFPFVIREAVNFHSTAGFNKSTGYPAYYYRKLGDVAGFTTVIDAHLSNIPMATQDEIAEIESLLESGVIL